MEKQGGFYARYSPGYGFRSIAKKLHPAFTVQHDNSKRSHEISQPLF